MAAVNNVPKDLQDAIREYLGRRVKLYIKRMVKQEVRPEKWENRVVAFSGSRLFVFSSKASKSPLEHNLCYLDIQSIESKGPNKLNITTYDGKVYSFLTLETETDEVNHMITHVGTSIKQIFPSFPVERIIKKIDVHPPERLKMMNDMIKTIESKEHGPCGNFAMMYACMCDYFNLPYREEVAWDVDTIYLSQDCRVLSLKDFDHLSGKDLQPIVASIEHNVWFTALNLNGVKLTLETQGEVLKVMQKNCLIEDLNLSNTGIGVDFVVKLGTAILSNTGSQLTRIDLSKNLLEDKAMISFLGSLSNLSRGLTHLNISNTKLTGKGLNKIFELLVQHESIFGGLQELNFSDNPTKGEDLQQMYKFLASPNGITHLDLSGTECALENLMVALQRGCTSVTHLFLSRNVYTYKKMKEIVVQPSWKQFFASACNLQHLDLSYCKMPVDALKELMLGISSNMHLKDLHLNIAGNDFQQQGSLNIESTIANIHNISSLDISNNNLDQGLATLLPWIKTNRSLKHLSIGRNFEHLKPKQLPDVLERVVQLIQDEDCDLKSLSLADSKLKHHISAIINALGSNGSLTELDISGNLMGDFGARMLSKALQINNKLKTILWDKNGTTAQGFEDIADALEKNYTMKKLPTPVNDVVLAQQRQPEKTEAAIQRIEALLQRNHSPQKYLVNRDYKIQGCYLSSTQQMVDRLIVQVQDTVNALQASPSAADYKDDIETAEGFVKDANGSQLLLPQLQDLADKSVGEDNPVTTRLKEISDDLKRVLDTQIKKTVGGMLECATKQLTAITKDKEFTTELNSGCLVKSTLPEDFASHTLSVVEMDIFNKLSELNLAVAAHISDRVIEAVIENLSSSHKKLTNHLNLEKSKLGKVIKPREEPKETEKKDKQEKESTEDTKSLDSKSADSSPVDTPNIASKRKTLNDRRKRPPTVIVGSQEDLTSVSELSVLPLKLDSSSRISSIPDLPTDDVVAPLKHLGKDRPKRLRTHRPGRPTAPTPSMVEQDKSLAEEDNNIDMFFKPVAVTNQLTVPQNKSDTEKDRKPVRKPSTDGKDGKSWFPFGSKDKDKKELSSKDKESKLNVLGRLGFGKGKKSESDKKEEVKPETEQEVIPDTENTEPEKSEESQPPEKEEPEVESKPETENGNKEEEVKEVKEPKKALRPPMAGMGFTSDMMNQLKLRQQNRKSVGKLVPNEPAQEKEVLKPPKKEKQDKPALVPETNGSKAAENATETKPTDDKAPKSILQLAHDQSRPKPVPRPVNNRASAESRSSAASEDGDTKHPKPAPKPRPNLPPKPRGSVKSDDLNEEILAEEKPESPHPSDVLQPDKKDKSASLPRNLPPMTDKAAKSARPVSMFDRANKDEKSMDKPLTASKSSGDLADTDKLVKDLEKIVEDKSEIKGDNEDEEKDVNPENDEKKENNTEIPDQNGESKRSSGDTSESVESNGDEKTEFEEDVIMV